MKKKEFDIRCLTRKCNECKNNLKCFEYKIGNNRNEKKKSKKKTV